MKSLILIALLGVVAADRFSAPSNSYSAPSAGFNGGFNGGLNGGNNNGYTAPNGGINGANVNGLNNGYSAPSNGGFNGGFNGGSNGYSNGGRNGGRNGRRNGGSNGYGTGGSNGLSSAYGAPGAAELAELASSLPGGGVPGEDFPVLSEVPDTGFLCEAQAVSGYYADVADEAGCQVFHICQLRENGRVQKDSFLCPNGTIFNQQYLVCDWWFNFDCQTAQDFYHVNELIGQDPNAAYGGQASSLNAAYGAPNGSNGFNGSNGNGYGNGNGNRNGRTQNGYSNGRNGRNGSVRNGNGSTGNGYSNSNGRNGNGNGNQVSSGYTSPGSRNGNVQNGGFGGY